MIEKHLLRPERLRRVPPAFSFIDHRLLRDGHLLRLQPHEMLLYFFLVLVADRHGLSYYSLPSISRYLKLPPEKLEEARTSLCERSLIAYESPLYQVLALPETEKAAPPRTPPPLRGGPPVSITELLRKVVEENRHGR